jgi:hypothetical protein
LCPGIGDRSHRQSFKIPSTKMNDPVAIALSRMPPFDSDSDRVLMGSVRWH